MTLGDLALNELKAMWANRGVHICQTCARYRREAMVFDHVRIYVNGRLIEEAWDK